MENNKYIKCPKCNTHIDVNDVLYHQLEEQIKKDYEIKNSEKEKILRDKDKSLKDAEEKLLEEKGRIEELIAAKVRENTKKEKESIEKTLREAIQKETSEQFDDLKKELEARSNQVKELNKTKAEIERLRREKDELREAIALEKEKEFSDKLKDERQKIQKQADESNTLKIREKEKLIDDLKTQLEEAKRKAEQGSMQLQGEIQELELERILENLYQYDHINAVRKGQRGADIIQIVRTPQGVECGMIYYESKRTKNFDNNWLQKLIDDNLDVKADILVLVTETMPDKADKFFYKDGVWICSFQEIKGLSLVLRHWLMHIQSVTVAQSGKETKMEMLYSYLISQEFRGQFEAIIEGFKSIQESHAEEKLKMHKIWKEREKQLEKILLNAVDFYGSIKGIAGASIPDIKMLEDEKTGQVLI